MIVTPALWLWHGERLAVATSVEVSQLSIFSEVFFFFKLVYLGFLRFLVFLSFIENHLSLTIYMFHCLLFTSIILFLLIFCQPFKWRNSILVSTFFVITKPLLFFFFLKAREHLLKRICSLFKKCTCLFI